jgi:hypothetical protein
MPDGIQKSKMMITCYRGYVPDGTSKSRRDVTIIATIRHLLGVQCSMPDGIQKSKIMMTCYRAAAAEVTCLTALSKSRSDVILVEIIIASRIVKSRSDVRINANDQPFVTHSMFHA